jgi:hypothetical protein
MLPLFISLGAATVGKNPGNNLSRQDPPRIGISAAA